MTDNTTNHPFKQGDKIVAYLRDSGGNEQDSSVLQQELFVRSWADRNGLFLAKIFKDDARSGSNVVGRDGFQELIQFFRKIDNNITGLVIWNYARFSRSIDDIQFFRADIRRRGFLFYSLNDNVPDGTIGRLLESIIDWKNEQYLIDLSKDIRRGLRYVTTIHHAYFGPTPTGYIRRPKIIGKRRDGTDHQVQVLEPDPAKAPLVRRAFELRASGATLSEIHRATGLFSWYSRYGRMLDNPLYIGEYHYGDLVVSDYCPPLVDLDTWQAAQVVNQERRERNGYNQPRAVRSRFALTGLLRCARCGGGMVGKVTPQRRPYTGIYLYYRCLSTNGGNRCGAKQIPKAEIEGRVLAAVKEQIYQPSVLSDIYAEVKRMAADNALQAGAVIQGKRDALEGVKSEIGRIVSAIREAGHSAALLKSLSELEDRQSEIETWLAREGERVPVAFDMDVETMARVLNEQLDQADEHMIGQVLRGFVVEVRAEKDGELRGELDFRLPGEEEGVHSVGL